MMIFEKIGDLCEYLEITRSKWRYLLSKDDFKRPLNKGGGCKPFYYVDEEFKNYVKNFKTETLSRSKKLSRGRKKGQIQQNERESNEAGRKWVEAMEKKVNDIMKE